MADSPLQAGSPGAEAFAGESARPRFHVPDHQLLRRIGRGAYGEVWLARNVMGVLRAVKVVYQNSFPDRTPYEREYRGIQKFEPISRSNDGFVDILQIGRNEEQGYFYYVMELADDAQAQRNAGQAGGALPNQADFGGASTDHPDTFPPRGWAVRSDPGDVGSYSPRTLRTEIRHRDRLPFEECLRYALWLNLALAHLHRQGLIHRDIKPSNIIFVHDVPKLADIGLVTEVEEARSLVGTEGFIPPEGANSPLSDIYALGKVLYEMSMGKDRTQFPEPFSALGRAPDSAGLEELNAIILKACAPDPRDRYQTAEEMHVDLAMLQSGKSVKWKRVVEKRLVFARRAGAVVGLLLVIAAGGWRFQSHQTWEAERLRAEAEQLARQLQDRNAEMEIKLAEDHFARGDASLALAHLAQVLRRHPDHRIAAERLVAALMQRKFPRPLATVDVPGDPIRLQAHRRAIEFSPDGRKLAIIAGDHTLRIWDPDLGTLHAIGPTHRDSLLWVEFSPDGEQIVLGSRDGTATLVEAKSGKLVHNPWEHDAPVIVARFDPYGRRLALAAGAQVRLMDLRTGGVEWSQTETGEVSHVEFSPDGRWLASTSEAGGVVVWNVDGGSVRHRFPTSGLARSLRFSPDGRRLAATVQSDQTSAWEVPIWGLDPAILPVLPLPHRNRIFSIEFSPDGSRLATATADRVARVWETATGRSMFEVQHRDIVYGVAFSPDGRLLLTASVDRTAQIWNAFHGATVSEPMRHDGRVLHARFSPDGRRAATLGWEDKQAVIWDISASPTSLRFLRHPGWITSVALTMDGRHAVTATRSTYSSARQVDRWSSPQTSSEVRLWNVATGATNSISLLPQGTEAVALYSGQFPARALVVRPGASPDAESEAWVWDLNRAEAYGPGFRVSGEIGPAAFSPDGTQVVVGTTRGDAQIFDARGGRRTAPSLTHGARLNAIAFAPDGATLVTAGADGMAVVWDAKTGARMALLKHPDEVWCVQFSPRGDRLLTGSRVQNLRVWETNGILVALLPHSGAVEYAEFSPDGTRVLSALGNGVAHVWHVNDATRIAELRHSQPLTIARFSPDGLRTVTGSEDGTAQLWDAATGLKLGDPMRHADAVLSAAFSPDGRRLITGTTGGAYLWELPLVPSPVPRWLPMLAEAVGGQRLNTNGILIPVDTSEFRIPAIPGAGPWLTGRGPGNLDASDPPDVRSQNQSVQDPD